MEKLRKRINNTTIVLTLIIVATYVVLFFYKEQQSEILAGKAGYLALTSFCFISSLLMLIVVALEKDDWFKELKDFRLNLALGCIIAVIFSGIDVFIKFHELFTSTVAK